MDVEKTKAFYRDKLGLKVTNERPGAVVEFPGLWFGKWAGKSAIPVGGITIGMVGALIGIHWSLALAALVLLTITLTLITSTAIVRERERGTLEQLVVSPVRPIELMAGRPTARRPFIASTNSATRSSSARRARYGMLWRRAKKLSSSPRNWSTPS